MCHAEDRQQRPGDLMGWNQLSSIFERARERAEAERARDDEHDICPACGVKTVTNQEGVKGCTFCEWSDN